MRNEVELMQELERIADKRHDGQFTIIRRRAGWWQVTFGLGPASDEMMIQTFAQAAEAALDIERRAHHRATQDRLRPQRQAGMVARRKARKLAEYRDGKCWTTI